MRQGLIAALLLLAIGVPTANAERPPNFLLILADDLGYSDLGCYGSAIETPNLDRLAQNGIRFTQFYNTARCWPTRAAILTGYYPQQIGRDKLPGGKGGARGRRPEWARLLPELLGKLEYRCYHSGKWHIDGKPTDQGFDRALTMDDHNRYFAPQSWTLDGERQPPIARESGYYQTTAIASHAIDCLQDHASKHPDQPFFHYVAFTCPHFPLHAPAKAIAKYRGKYHLGWDSVRAQRWERIQSMQLVSGALSQLEPSIGPPYHRPADLEQLGHAEVNRERPWSELTPDQQSFQARKMEIHAAMVDQMDTEIGRIVDQVTAMDALDNTLILFLSDNGASAEIMIRGDGHDANAELGSARSYVCLGPGWSCAANTPFRRHKTWVHEGGISTPMIAHWPRGIRNTDALRQDLAHVIDIPPTLLDLAGGEWPTAAGSDPVPPPAGMSLAAALRGQPATRQRTLWWCHEGHRALRQGDFKLVAARDEDWQLYDCRNDRAEADDLAPKMPDRVQAMREKWQAMAESFASTADR